MAAKHPMKQRSYRGGFLPKLLTVLAAVAAVVIGVTIFFKVQTVTVIGAARYSDKTLIDASGITGGENLMTLNKSAIAQNIYTKLPYIEQVRVARQLPDTVIIEVTECEAMAVVQDAAGGQWLLSASGKIVEQTGSGDTDTSGLIEVQGAEITAPEVGRPAELDTPEKTAALTGILQALRGKQILPGVRSVNLEKTYELVLQYEDRFDVQLGGTDQLDYKIRYLEEIICNQLDATKTGTIDLTLEEEGVARLIPRQA